MNINRYLRMMITLCEFELRKIKHDQSQIWLRGIQPALWLIVFGSVFSSLRSIPLPPGLSYLQFMTPGVLAQSAMFVAIFYGINLVWERDLGLLNKLLSTPAPRSAIVIGKALSAGVRSIFQGAMVIALALIIGINISLNPLGILGLFLCLILTGMCFSSMSIALASVFRTRERMMGIGQALTMPLFFASNAIYPISMMPDWLKVIVVVNPLSYAVDALRVLLVSENYATIPIDVFALSLATGIIIVVASFSFRRMTS